MSANRLPAASSSTALTLFPVEQLLSALSHEVANHLTAARMHAELFEMGRSARASSQAVMSAAGRAGSLSACVSLLAQAAPEHCELNPLALLDSVRERVATTYSTRLNLEQHSGTAMRRARGELEEYTRVLTLLAVEMHCAADEGTNLALSANTLDGFTQISITAECSRMPVINPSHPGTGLVLALHIAEAIARRNRAEVSLHSLGYVRSISVRLQPSQD